MTADAPSSDDSLPDAAVPSPSYDAIDSPDDLRRWSAAYCERAVREHRMDVDLSPVDWTVSTRARRRAAAVKRPRLSDAEVGERLDWTAVECPEGRKSPADGRTDDDPVDGGRPCRCTLSLTWAAFEAFDRAEWTAVLRHELVHVEQFQRFGTTDHGPAFRRRARTVDATLACEPFATPAYRLRCADCGRVVARRYRDCKLVRQHDRYTSSCCASGLWLEESGEG